MTTTTNLAEATLPGQVIVPHFPSHPSLVHEAPIIPKPSPKRPTNKPMPNTGVLCYFHQFSGHDTEYCVALRNIIEGLIHQGKLDKYVHNLPPPPNPH
ncbi:unnamed protein product [Prunus armeniaca]